MPSSEHSPVDIVWVLICAALVMLMQGGFSCLESGLARSKNSINVAMKNFFDFCISSTVFWIVGYGLMFGASRAGLFGATDFCVDLTNAPWLTTFFLFQLVFCGTSTTIVSGAVAERMHFASYSLTAVLVSALIYPVVGHWAWGGALTGDKTGWLVQIGFLDFAGSTVVHSVGGWVSLALVLLIGPRVGRFGPRAVSMNGHDLPLATLGAFLLWFGWFGFNGGSVLALNDTVPAVLVNTLLAAAAGGLSGSALGFVVYRRHDVGSLINGALGGLVGITASANLMTTPAAILIGLIAGVLAVWTTRLLERWHIDDVVGAIPVHGICGVFGTLAVALFAADGSWGTGLTRWEQLGVQALGAGATFAWSFGVAYGVMWVVRRWMPLRVDEQAERVGLNVAEHGASTEILDLMVEMDQHREIGQFSRPVTVEPHTEVGQIAAQYNRVLERVDSEIKKQQAAETALRTAEAKYRSIFENAVGGIFQTTPNGHYLSANPALAQIYGYASAAQLMAELNDIGRQLYVDPSRRDEFVATILREGAVSDFESEVYRRDGSTVWISEAARAVRDEAGNIAYYEGTVLDISERRQTEAELQRMQQQLLEAARRDGMAEIATGVLHNVGNVLNSVNVSATLVADRLRNSKVADLTRVIELIDQYKNDLGTFITADERGKHVPGFLSMLASHLERERAMLLDEITSLTKNIDHIKTIVSMQQSYAGASGVVETVSLAELFDDALKMNWSSYEKYGIEVVREYEDLPEVEVEKQKLLQILVNLVKNAKDALVQSGVARPTVTLRVVQQDERVALSVVDNGVGIPPENLTRIFSHGFTTKPDGHGFGLHASANAARQMGGSLAAYSEGQGCGATFTVEVPFQTVEVFA